MRLALFVLILFAGFSAAAQEPDTTDWHRYVPLAVGNAWQYRIETGVFPTLTTYAVAEVVATTEIDGQPYYEVVECLRDEDDPSPCLTSGPRTLVRYDEEMASVAERVEAGGTVTHRPWGDYPCGLDAPSSVHPGIDLPCPGGEIQRWEDIIRDQYEVYSLLGGTLSGGISEKNYVTVASGAVVVSDVGLISAMLGDPGCGVCVGLIYARLDGVEYGEQAVVVGREDVAPSEERGLTVYPNPLHNAATLRFALAAPERLTLAVYDVRGRRVRSADLGAHGAGEGTVRFEAADLPPGAYHLRLNGDGGFTAARGVIVLR